MRIIALVVSSFIIISIFGQEDKNGILSLPVNTYDFGRIMEDGGKVQHRFILENSGTSEFSIVYVRTTCGCATPLWTENPITPGAQGYVEIEFNPSGRSGDFHKTIQIQSTANNSNMFVSLSGTVVPAFKKEELHHKIGGLAIKADQVNLGYLYKGTTGTEYITIRNTTKTKLELAFDDVPEHIMIDAYPPVLNPGEYGQIEVIYCTEKIEDWDVVINQVKILLNKKPVRKKKLSIIANIREDFRNMTDEQKLAAPVAVYQHDNFEFDTISSEVPRECRFMIKNTGKTDLKIRAVKASCGCTVVAPEKSTLAPGEVTYIDAVFDPRGRSGKFKNGITVVTNDPAHYKKYLFVEGYIRESSK